jgi:hypothetical protein
MKKHLIQAKDLLGPYAGKISDTGAIIPYGNEKVTARQLLEKTSKRAGLMFATLNDLKLREHFKSIQESFPNRNLTVAASLQNIDEFINEIKPILERDKLLTEFKGIASHNSLKGNIQSYIEHKYSRDPSKKYNGTFEKFVRLPSIKRGPKKTLEEEGISETPSIPALSREEKIRMIRQKQAQGI